jgi:hypothetical protein
VTPVGTRSGDQRESSGQRRLLPHGEQIRSWLEPQDEPRGLRLTRVRELLARPGVDVPYGGTCDLDLAAAGAFELV